MVILLLFFRGKLPVRGRNKGPREVIWLFEAVELVNNSPKVVVLILYDISDQFEDEKVLEITRRTLLNIHLELIGPELSQIPQNRNTQINYLYVGCWHWHMGKLIGTFHHLGWDYSCGRCMWRGLRLWIQQEIGQRF